MTALAFIAAIGWFILIDRCVRSIWRDLHRPRAVSRNWRIIP